jgi:hypothetical protein
MTAIANINYPGGGTYIAGGMDYAIHNSFSRSRGNRDDVQDVMILMTDGYDSYSSDVGAAYAEATANGITVLCIGVGNGVKMSELMEACGNNASHVSTVGNFADLSQITQTICDEVVADSDPCNPDPCHGNGACAPNGEDFVCACNSGYGGDECAQSVCYNGGELQCVCAFGYTGEYCETPINYCTNTSVLYDNSEKYVPICGARGQCKYDQTNGSYCDCQPGWQGVWCEENIDACSSNPCLHNGTCTDLDTGLDYLCTCDEYHEGPNCETNKNPCNELNVMHNGTVIQLNPCGEYGTCIPDASGGVLCLCSDGWNGTFCEHEILKGCQWTNGKTYPHNSTWISGCNSYSCEYGLITESKAYWCPQRCALYATNMTIEHNISTDCPDNQNCIPDNVQCAKPTCANPVGWCMPVGMVIVDPGITFPTNPPNGYKHFK